MKYYCYQLIITDAADILRGAPCRAFVTVACLSVCHSVCPVDRHLSRGVARNFRQGVRQSVAFLSVHSRSAALPSRPYNQKTS